MQTWNEYGLTHTWTPTHSAELSSESQSTGRGMEEDGGITLSTLSGESSAYLQQMLHVSHTMKERLHAESTLHSQHLSTLYAHAALKQHTVVRFLKTCSRTCYKPAVIRQMSLIFHPVLLTNIFASDLRWSDSTILISRNDTLVFYFYYIAE